MSTAEPVRRASEIEEFSNLYFIHPLANRLVVVFDRLGFTPNLVSLLGMACGLASGWAYYHYRDPRYALGGFLLMLGWHILDGADGQLARLQNAQSEFGKIIDGICDYTTFISVYVGLSLALSRDYGSSIWLLTVPAGVCHAMQAAAYEVQRQEYNSWGLERRSALLPRLDSILRTDDRPGPAQRVMRRLYWVYVWMQYRVSGSTEQIRVRVEEALASHPAQAEQIRSEYRRIFAPSVRHWAILSSNYRTLMIVALAMAKMPVLYFAFEIVGLNLIVWVLSRRQVALFRVLDAALPRPAAR